MKPKDLKAPFRWADRRPFLQDRVLFVPHYYDRHQEWTFPGLNSTEVFTRPAPVFIEYCSGNGDWIVEKALQQPEFNWVAVEKRFDRVRKIWSKMCNQAVNNLLIVCGEALPFTQYYLPDNVIKGVYINFPDPWPKGKHAKHRLFQESFVTQMARVVIPEGKATIVTDDAQWTERICSAMAPPDWSPLFSTPHYRLEWPEYGFSYFQDLWVKMGRLIHYMQFTNAKST